MEWINVLKDSPLAIAVLVVVVLFLRFIREDRAAQSKRDEQFEERATLRNKLFADTIEKMSKQANDRARECHEVHAQSVATIERNTAAFLNMERQLERWAETHDHGHHDEHVPRNGRPDGS